MKPSWVPEQFREQAVMLGENHAYIPTAVTTGTHISSSGIIFLHKQVDRVKFKLQQWCHASLYYDTIENRFHHPEQTIFWRVECEEPLSVAPSIRCSVDGVHGHIQGGKWFPAKDSVIQTP